MSTIMVTLKPDVSQGTGAPRAMRIRFPMGNPMGEPHKPAQQRRILLSALELIAQLPGPGWTVEMPYRWRRMGV